MRYKDEGSGVEKKGKDKEKKASKDESKKDFERDKRVIV